MTASSLLRKPRFFQSFPAAVQWRFSWSHFFNQVWSLALMLVLGAANYLLISHFIFQSVQVSGQSMYPTLTPGGNYWVNHCAYLKHEPQRADIVAVKDPQDGVLIVKRIIALPGESVYFKHGVVYVNGQKLSEAYLPPHTPTYAYEKNEDEMVCYGKDEYFVLGDNRGNSTDSRTFGAVPREDILGKVVE